MSIFILSAIERIWHSLEGGKREAGLEYIMSIIFRRKMSTSYLFISLSTMNKPEV